MLLAIAGAISGYVVRFGNGIFNRGDPLMTAWILAWGQHQIVRNPLRIFQANIFYPFRDTFAYTENILGPALLASPARLFTDNAIAIQNFSILTAFLALGLAAYIYFFWITSDVLGAACGAVFVALSPVRFAHLGHIQLLHSAGLPLLLFLLQKHFEKPRASTAGLAVAAALYEFLSSFYLAVMVGIIVFLFLILALPEFGRERWKIALRQLIPWSALSLLVVVPIVTPYARLAREFGFVRSIEGMGANWASHKDYVRPPFGSFAGRVAGKYGAPVGKSLYLGSVAILLAAIGLGTRQREDSQKSDRARFASRLWLLLGIAFFILSLGGWRTVGSQRILLPFYWLHELPGFEGIRTPHRFGAVVDLAVAGLLALGLARLHRGLAQRLPPLAAATPVLLIGALSILERVPLPLVPLEHVETGAQVPRVYRWLAHDSDEARVLELPMSTEIREREGWDVVQFRQVYYTTYHWKKTINGLSGYAPPGYTELQARLRGFPNPESLRILEALPINRVVVHRTLYPVPIPSSMFRQRGLRVLYDTPEALVVEFPDQTRGLRRDNPRLELRSEPSSNRPLRFRIAWSEGSPVFLYPPVRIQFTVRSVDSTDRERKTERTEWVVDPMAKDYRVMVPSGSRSFAIEVTADHNLIFQRAWNLWKVTEWIRAGLGLQKRWFARMGVSAG